MVDETGLTLCDAERGEPRRLVELHGLSDAERD